MALFGKKEGGLMDVIRCDEPSYLIWKWRPAGSDANDTKKENAIRWGSSLRVLSAIFLVLFVAEQMIFSIVTFCLPPYIIITGILLLLYILIRAEGVHTHWRYALLAHRLCGEKRVCTLRRQSTAPMCLIR